MTHLNVLLENNEQAVFFAGQILRGTIELHLSDAKQVNGLYFIVNGRAKTHWSETERKTVGTGDNRRTTSHTVYYEGKEIYMNARTYLLGHQGRQSSEMQPGVYRYTFETLLPSMLPASFEGAHGDIRYNVEACLDIPWRFDKEYKLPFHVVRNDDLNAFPDLKIPFRNEQLKTFCCLFCKSEPLIITVTIPCGGFTPGSSIPITIEYINKSDVEIDSTKINLKRTVKFNSHTPHCKTKVMVDKMVEVFKDGVAASTSRTVVENLQLPSTLVNTNNRICNVIQITYDLKIEAQTSGCHSNFEMIFPIVIGTVPLNFGQQGQFTQLPISEFTDNTTQMPYSYPNAPSAPMPSAPITNGFSNPIVDLPPPSFDEAIKISHEKVNADIGPNPNIGFGWNVAQPPSAPAEKGS